MEGINTVELASPRLALIDHCQLCLYLWAVIHMHRPSLELLRASVDKERADQLVLAESINEMTSAGLCLSLCAVEGDLEVYKPVE